MKKFIIKIFLTACFIWIAIFSFIFFVIYIQVDIPIKDFNANDRDSRLSGPVDEGMKAFNQHDWQTAMKLWKPLAENGNAASQNNVGILYLGVQRNYAEALKWYHKAADQGDMKAEWMLGTMNSGGPIGGKCDPTEAEKWFRKAAEQGDSYLQLSLGGIYERGGSSHNNCIKKDYAKALQWYLKSAKRGALGAERALAKMYDLGEGVKKDEVKAAKWVRKAADRGWDTSQMQLSNFYYDGKGVPQDYAESYFWCKLAVKNGALGNSLPQEVQSFWDERAFEKHLTPEQMMAMDKRVEKWRLTPAPDKELKEVH